MQLRSFCPFSCGIWHLPKYTALTRAAISFILLSYNCPDNPYYPNGHLHYLFLEHTHIKEKNVFHFIPAFCDLLCVNVDLKLTKLAKWFCKHDKCAFCNSLFVNKQFVVKYKLLFEPSYQESVPFLISLVVLPIGTTTSAVSNSPSAASN